MCAPLPAGRDPTCYQCRAFSWRQIRCLVKKVSRESDAFSHSGLSSSLFVLLSFSQMSGQSKKGQKVCMCGWLALQQCIMVQPAIVMSRIQQFACYNLRHILQRDQNIQLLWHNMTDIHLFLSLEYSDCSVDRWRDGGMQGWRRRRMPREGTMRRRRLKQAP